MPRDEDARSSARWNEPSPEADPHGDLTGALHDVSNALTVLLGWASEARSGRPNAAQLERALAIMEEKAREARDMARRAIGAQTSIDDNDAAIDAVASDVLETLSVEADRAGVVLEASGQVTAARISDASDASRVLTNLIMNAIAWTPRGGRVRVETEADAMEAFVTVSDDGPGVEPKSAPRLFDGGKSARKGGAGIGLRHARALARRAGGDLELVQVEAVGAGAANGNGARFRLRWPRVRPAIVGRAPPSSPSATVLSGSRVLVVEDDQDVATLLESALAARGAHVVVARNAEELVSAAAERHDAALVEIGRAHV